MQSKKQKLPPASNGGDVNIEGHEHNRNHWKFGIAESLIVERDEVTRAAKVRTDWKINFGNSNTAVIPIRATL